MCPCKGTREQLDILIFTLYKIKMTLKNFTYFFNPSNESILFYSIFIEQKIGVCFPRFEEN